MAVEVTIRDRSIGEGRPVFIIAEAGVNHNGSLEMAKRLVDVAVEARADAVKFQTFVAEEVMSRRAPKANYQMETTSPEESQIEMARGFQMPPEAFAELSRYCAERGIWFVSTPFDFVSVDTLDSLDVPLIKLSSGDLSNLPLVSYVAAKGRPVMLSTGLAHLSEVDEAVRAAFATGNRQVILLHCTTSYPARVEEANLRAIATLRAAFPVPVGYSDHTPGIEVAIASVVAGACVVEKHFTLDKNLPGPDHRASLEPGELKEMVRAIRNVENALGDGVKRPMEGELANKPIARKSLVARRPLARGAILTREALAIKRPGTGIEPRFADLLIGKRVWQDVEEDETLQWDMFLAGEDRSC